MVYDWRGAVQRALGLIDVGCGQGRAQVFQAQVVGGQLRGVGLNAHRGLLPAGDGDQAHAGDLGDLLRQVGVGRVFDLVQRKGVGVERQRHDRRVGGVDLAIDGRIGQVGGQKAVAGVDGRLHLLLGHVDVLVEIEFQRDDRAAAASSPRSSASGPGIWPNWRSKGAVTEEAITSGPAPG